MRGLRSHRSAAALGGRKRRPRPIAKGARWECPTAYTHVDGVQPAAAQPQSDRLG